MRRRTAQCLTMAFLVNLGAAQRPNIRGSAKSAITEAEAETSMRRALVPPARASVHPYQVGTASWYGEDFAGKPTASGEPYNMFDLTAAHPTLPLGSFVRVTNLRNGRSVVVKVNDRGPIVPGRIIDVSYSTARVLQFKAQGLQRVRLDLVQPKMAQPQTMAMLRPMAF